MKKFRIIQKYDADWYLSNNMPEPKNKKEALAQSVSKWRAIVRFMVAHPEVTYVQDGAITTCGLCKRFYLRGRDKGYNCMGCPVRKSTGQASCIGTPYDEEWGEDFEDRDRNLKAARAELKFLQSLK